MAVRCRQETRNCGIPNRFLEKRGLLLLERTPVVELRPGLVREVAVYREMGPVLIRVAAWVDRLVKGNRFWAITHFVYCHICRLEVW